jgi:hypothetical protein
MPRRTLLLPILVLCALAAWIVGTRAHTFDEPFERDIVTAILMGRELAAGGRMYVDVIEFKPPGSFALWQLVEQTIGTRPFQVGVVNIVVAVLTMLGVYRAARALADASTAAGLWAAAFWALACGEMYLQANQPNIEVFMNLGVTWAVALLVAGKQGEPLGWRRGVGAGLLFSFATLQKHHLILVVGCLGIAWLVAALLEPREMRREKLAPRPSRRLHHRIDDRGVWLLVTAYFAVTDASRSSGARS